MLCGEVVARRQPLHAPQPAQVRREALVGGGGLNIRQVQLLLGHSDLQVTMQYLCYDFEEVQRQAARVDFGLTLRPVLER